MAVDEPLVRREAGGRGVVAEVVVRDSHRAVARHVDRRRKGLDVAGRLVDSRQGRPGEPAVRGLREDDGAVQLLLGLPAAEAVSPHGIDVAVPGARRVAVDGDDPQADVGEFVQQRRSAQRSVLVHLLRRRLEGHQRCSRASRT